MIWYMKRHYNAKFNIEIEKEICSLYQESVFNNSMYLARKYKCQNNTIINILRFYNIKVRNGSECQIDLRTGKNHPMYKGGNISRNGYKRIYINKKIIQEHRYIMELHIGRKLLPSEIVHHINHNKLDNRLENLQLTTRSKHKKMHNDIGLKTRFKKHTISH